MSLCLLALEQQARMFLEREQEKQRGVWVIW